MDMGFLDRLRGKKAEEKPTKEQPAEEAKAATTGLESICGDDREAYEALRRTMLLDPRKAGVTIAEAEERAKDFEKEGDAMKARIWYEQAGGLAIYKGDAKKVTKYFGKAAKLSPNTSYPIVEIPDRAVAKAQEYYKEYLKE